MEVRNGKGKRELTAPQFCPLEVWPYEALYAVLAGRQGFGVNVYDNAEMIIERNYNCKQD